jgi:UPF0042 nucleotide-binding protein
VSKEYGRLVILTGMSGAGKSTALRTFEDLGYYCIDNLPPTLIETFLQLYSQAAGSQRGITIVCDVRSGELFSHLREAIGLLADKGHNPEVIFFDCADDVLISRYSEARRNPPLGLGMRLEEAVRMERELLEPLRDVATVSIDTSDLSAKLLRERILGLYGTLEGDDKVSVTVLSFGFKYGLPTDADFVFDTRFLPNPFYVESLRPQTGNDAAVARYVMEQPLALDYLAQIHRLLQFALPHYTDVHKHYAVVALGCTGGRHRSVALANELTRRMQDDGLRCIVQHRDI